MIGPLELSQNLEYYGKVRCPLYDTIPFTCAEICVIDTPEFQRLRRLKQTAFTHFVFPGATHTRFEHSLGVMHMAGIFLNAIVRNQSKLLATSSNTQGMKHGHGLSLLSDLPEIAATQKPLEVLSSDRRVLQAVRFAGLLHDLGHAPFSHSGERFLPTWNKVAVQLKNFDIPAWLREAFSKKIERYAFLGPRQMNTQVRHEFYSLLLIAKVFRRLDQESPRREFLDESMAQDVCALIDKDVCPEKSSSLNSFGLRSLLSEMISGEIDADRMDYLQRDAMHCGVVYGLFDAGRILDASVFYANSATGQLHLALYRSGLAAYEDYLRARMSMYQQVYFHKTGTACEAMLEQIRKKARDFSLPLDADEYMQFDDSSFYFILKDALQRGDHRSDKLPFELKEELLGDLNDLLTNRKIWKRVYEESHSKVKFDQVSSLVPPILAFLKSKGIVCELIESETNLSRFAPKGRSGTSGVRFSENSLKVVVKNVRGQISLQPIEDHSRLINNLDEERVLQRIFAWASTPQEVTDIQEAIADFLEGQSQVSESCRVE